jgi:hypothetical protein
MALLPPVATVWDPSCQGPGRLEKPTGVTSYTTSHCVEGLTHPSYSRSIVFCLCIMYVYIYIFNNIIYKIIQVCMHIYKYMSLCVCTYVRTYVRMVRMVRMHACMHACMYVCMYVIRIFTPIHISRVSLPRPGTHSRGSLHKGGGRLKNVATSSTISDRSR